MVVRIISGYNQYYKVRLEPFLTQDEENLRKVIDSECATSPHNRVAEEAVKFIDGFIPVEPGLEAR
jgi:hypothetical protein